MGRFGTPEVVHTDRGAAFHNELIFELLRMSSTEQSLTTAYSSEENGKPGGATPPECNPFRFSGPQQVVFRTTAHGSKDHEHS
jgi:hypothetical protein